MVRQGVKSEEDCWGNAGKSWATEEGHGSAGSTNMWRSSLNSPGASASCWWLRPGPGKG